MLVAESALCTNHYLAESRMKDYSIVILRSFPILIGAQASKLGVPYNFSYNLLRVAINGCMKLAFRMCKFYPELMDELKRILEAMEIDYYKPAVKCVRNRILNGKLK